MDPGVSTGEAGPLRGIGDRGADSGGDSGMSDFVFTFTFETYDDAVTRGMNRPPDRLLATLLDHPRVDGLLVANPHRSLLKRGAKKLLGGGDAPFPARERVGLHTPLRLRASDPVDIGGLRAAGQDYDASLRRAAARLGLRTPHVITASPLVAGFAPLDWAASVTYYARDDWTELPARRPWWPGIREAYRQIATRGASVAAVSQQIIDRIEPIGPARVVPNGVEPAEWAGETPAEPDWLATIPRPRALYVGTLDSRLDTAGLRVLADARPELQIVLLGVVGEEAAVASIASVPNIHVRPPVGRAPLVAAIRNSDMCLVAHNRTRLTEAMSPLKIYEYLAGGAPVLSIDLEPVRGISDRVLLTQDVAGFAERLDEALAHGPAREDDRLRFVGENSWRSRHEQILDLALGVRAGVTGDGRS
ncbi:glycosyltransferase family 1 protein [Salinibacterium sp. dk2585]|nr:glycosyltransferase family 1 protein [Salinibacterium sp. dk2585]